MFHRRLLLLGAVVALLLAVLLTQLTYLTVAEGHARRENAEAVLSQYEFVPTKRGSILDARGRVLATDVLTYDVAVRYPVLTGAWTYRQAYRAARREHRPVWSELSYLQRQQHIAEHERRIEAELEQFWAELCDIGGIERQELEERTTEIRRRVQQMASAVWLQRLERRVDEVPDDERPARFADVAQPIGPQVEAHAVLQGVGEEAHGRIRKRQIEADDASVWREVEVIARRQRHYPEDEIALTLERTHMPPPLQGEPLEMVVRGVGMHVIGAMRKVQAEDVQRLPFRRADGTVDLQGYVSGDVVGRWGIEAAMERELRGRRGRVTRYLDSGEEVREPPTPGQDVQLSIDIDLQARVQALLSRREEDGPGLLNAQPWHSGTQQPEGAPLNGAAVVLEVATGKVLASVSAPTFSRRMLDDYSQLVFADEVNRPWVDRVAGSPQGGIYQCGSTVKPMAFAAAVTEGKLGLHQPIECTGYLIPPGDPTKYRCWIFKQSDGAHTHGPLVGHDALARSCNLFFYTIGRRMGPENMVRWYEQFGLGRPPGSELDEAAGDLPDLAAAHDRRAPGFTPADGIFMAIGQGPVRWTPLQAANAYATLARDGYWLSPTFLAHPARHGVQRETHDLRISPAVAGEALRGLREAVGESFGTGHHFYVDGRRVRTFDIEGLTLYGKSGTADAAAQRIDSNGDGRITTDDRVVRDGDHAWFICMAQKPGSARPDYVVAVIVEYGGSGGSVSGPIANQILHAMRAAGYL